MCQHKAQHSKIRVLSTHLVGRCPWRHKHWSELVSAHHSNSFHVRTWSDVVHGDRKSGIDPLWIIRTIINLCCITGKQISEKCFTYLSLQLFRISRRFLFSKIWSSAQDHAVLVLLLNLVGFFISYRPRWSCGNVCTTVKPVWRWLRQPFNIFTFLFWYFQAWAKKSRILLHSLFSFSAFTPITVRAIVFPLASANVKYSLSTLCALHSTKWTERNALLFGLALEFWPLFDPKIIDVTTAVDGITATVNVSSSLKSDFKYLALVDWSLFEGTRNSCCRNSY